MKMRGPSPFQRPKRARRRSLAVSTVTPRTRESHASNGVEQRQALLVVQLRDDGIGRVTDDRTEYPSDVPSQKSDGQLLDFRPLFARFA